MNTPKEIYLVGWTHDENGIDELFCTPTLAEEGGTKYILADLYYVLNKENESQLQAIEAQKKRLEKEIDWDGLGKILRGMRARNEQGSLELTNWIADNRQF